MQHTQAVQRMKDKRQHSSGSTGYAGHAGHAAIQDMQRKPQPVLLVDSKVSRTYVRLVASATSVANHRQC
jgi:hypothetical protein